MIIIRELLILATVITCVCGDFMMRGTADEATVCSLNVWGLKYITKSRKSRIRRLARDLPTSNCDIIALQELFVGSDFEELQEYTQRTHPFSVWFKSGVVGSGLAIFSKFPVVESWYAPYRMSGQFREWLHGDWFAAKGIAHARIRLNSGMDLDVITTHLIANYGKSGDIYLLQRYAQTYELTRYISRLGSEAFVLMGDFNYDTGHPAFTSVMENGLFTKYWFERVPVGPTFNLPSSANHKRREPEQAIDHCFYSGQLELRNHSLVFQDGYSDHAGVQATFKWSRGAGKTKRRPSNYFTLHTMMTLLSEEIHRLDRLHARLSLHFFIVTVIVVVSLWLWTRSKWPLVLLVMYWTYQAFVLWIFQAQERSALEQLWNEWSLY